MQSVEQIARKLMDKHLLDRIDLRITRGSMYAHAIPMIHHPKVEARRIKAFGEHESSALSLAEIVGITNDAMKPVASAKAPTLQEVINVLAHELAMDNHNEKHF